VARWNVQIAVLDRTVKDLFPAAQAVDSDFLVGEDTITVTVTADSAQAASERVDAHLISRGLLRATAIASVVERGRAADAEQAS
jgi:hypothetical protein